MSLSQREKNLDPMKNTAVHTGLETKQDCVAFGSIETAPAQPGFANTTEARLGVIFGIRYKRFLLT